MSPGGCYLDYCNFLHATAIRVTTDIHVCNKDSKGMIKCQYYSPKLKWAIYITVTS